MLESSLIESPELDENPTTTKKNKIWRKSIVALFVYSSISFHFEITS